MLIFVNFGVLFSFCGICFQNLFDFIFNILVMQVMTKWQLRGSCRVTNS